MGEFPEKLGIVDAHEMRNTLMQKYVDIKWNNELDAKKKGGKVPKHF